ncbi:sigma-70 family RNA polymerase sigma factor [Kutzneria viridogrisea]|uniref:RNA polymerase sigma-70 factor (ECF subfamily) n=1 Tax=Kutzneria viridogrisea TaxID=47990 RepID=A0ABR6BQE0_9PSEU|nr:RNA polymerase sigma-70 factor (ECF subfamily) [Kutzneria viridogrisea]
MPAQTRSDLELMSSAAGGDLAAFDELVRRHTTRMYRVALRIVADPVEAEDVVQDSWVSAWRALSGFRGESAPTTWLYRVVTNAALLHLRRRKQTVPLDTVLEDTNSRLLADTRVGPEGEALRGEQVDAVLRAIATLEPSQRVPLVLRELEGMSYEEVAAVLDIGVPALRSRLHRARVALLAKLKELR